MTFIHIYVNFWTPYNMEGTLSRYLVSSNLIILEGVKEVVKSSQLANFQAGSSLIFPGFIPILMKFWTPFIWAVKVRLHHFWASERNHQMILNYHFSGRYIGFYTFFLPVSWNLELPFIRGVPLKMVRSSSYFTLIWGQFPKASVTNLFQIGQLVRNEKWRTDGHG